MIFKKRRVPERQLSSVEVFKQKSENAITVVRNVINSLKTTNEEVNSVVAENTAKISVLEQENKLLGAIVCSNAKVVENFENLLN